MAFRKFYFVSEDLQHLLADYGTCGGRLNRRLRNCRLRIGCGGRRRSRVLVAVPKENRDGGKHDTKNDNQGDSRGHGPDCINRGNKRPTFLLRPSFSIIFWGVGWQRPLHNGGPVGFRMALAHPERVQALIVQDAVAHNEGLGANWATRRAFWADRPAHEESLRKNLLSLATTKTRHIGDDPQIELYDPDLWTDEYAFLNAPGQAQIQSDLLVCFIE
jgi:hypothetical protein